MRAGCVGSGGAPGGGGAPGSGGSVGSGGWPGGAGSPQRRRLPWQRRLTGERWLGRQRGLARERRLCEELRLAWRRRVARQRLLRLTRLPPGRCRGRERCGRGIEVLRRGSGRERRLGQVREVELRPGGRQIPRRAVGEERRQRWRGQRGQLRRRQMRLRRTQLPVGGVDEAALGPVRAGAGEGEGAADACLVRRRLLAQPHVRVPVGKLAAVVVGTRSRLHPVATELGLILVRVAGVVNRVGSSNWPKGSLGSPGGIASVMT